MANNTKISPVEEHPQKAFWMGREGNLWCSFPILNFPGASFSSLKFLSHEYIATGEEDITFEVLYSGIFQTLPIWLVSGAPLASPMIPSLLVIKNIKRIPCNTKNCRHEIVGVVTEVGNKVQKFKVAAETWLVSDAWLEHVTSVTTALII
ncbi:hypothetical protein RJ641_010060 [Dillenia turbinata]|uniref:Uncharacterized protein n=1 Tax=Dillenia turbinata TaxID=194707 RepID=A0AAN8UXM7_9MAGN